MLIFEAPVKYLSGNIRGLLTIETCNSREIKAEGTELGVHRRGSEEVYLLVFEGENHRTRMEV
jgi:hypothetical protein